MTEWWANVYVYTYVEHGKFCDGAQRRLSRFRADCEAEEAPDRNRFRIHVRLKPTAPAPTPSQGNDEGVDWGLVYGGGTEA